ncbi:MAG TPA: hypothetical protein VJB82_02565 [Candidatus Peribacterales bacterium]|nr:hypothetical protein [Candidatus Peribacterales bacterium]
MHKESRLLFQNVDLPNPSDSKGDSPVSKDFDVDDYEKNQKKDEKRLVKKQHEEEQKNEERAADAWLQEQLKIQTPKQSGFAKLPESKRENDVLNQFSAAEKRQILEAVASHDALPQHIRLHMQQLDIFRTILDETLAQLEDPTSRGGKGIQWGRRLGIPQMYNAMGFRTSTDIQKALKAEIESFYENDYPKIVQELLQGKTNIGRVTAKYPLLQRVAMKYDLRLADAKNEEEILIEQNQLMSYLRVVKNYDGAAIHAENILHEEFAKIEATLTKQERDDCTYQAEVASTELVMRHIDGWRNPSDTLLKQGAKPMTDEQINQVKAGLKKEKNRAFLNVEIAKKIDPSNLKGAKLDIWTQYNDMLDPQREYFNVTDAHFDMIMDEVAINVPLIMMSGGSASAVRVGMTAAASSMMMRIFTVSVFKEGAKLTARQAITAGAKKTAAWAGGRLVEGAAFEVVHSTLKGEYPKDLPDWGNRILWSAATLGLFHGAGKLGDRILKTTVLKNCFAKITSEPARKTAELLLVKGHIEAAAMMVMGAAQNGAMNGNLNEFYENFGEELLHAYVSVGALKVGHASVETLTGKMFRPAKKKTDAGERLEMKKIEKQETDRLETIQDTAAIRELTLEPISATDKQLYIEQRSSISNTHRRAWNNAKKPIFARSEVYSAGKDRVSATWITLNPEGVFGVNANIPKNSLTYKYMKSAPGTKEHNIFLRAEKILVEAFYKAEKFLRPQREINNGFVIEGQEGFGMEKGNTFGTRVSYRRVEDLLRSIESGEQSPEIVSEFLMGEFIHERVHNLRGDNHTDNMADEIAPHAVQFLALEGKNSLFNEQMEMGLNRPAEDKYDIEQPMALRVVSMQLRGLAKQGRCTSPKGYTPNDLRDSISSIAPQERGEILRTFADEIITTKKDNLMETANVGEGLDRAQRANKKLRGLENPQKRESRQEALSELKDFFKAQKAETLSETDRIAILEEAAGREFSPAERGAILAAHKKGKGEIDALKPGEAFAKKRELAEAFKDNHQTAIDILDSGGAGKPAVQGRNVKETLDFFDGALSSGRQPLGEVTVRIGETVQSQLCRVMKRSGNDYFIRTNGPNGKVVELLIPGARLRIPPPPSIQPPSPPLRIADPEAWNQSAKPPPLPNRPWIQPPNVIGPTSRLNTNVQPPMPPSFNIKPKSPVQPPTPSTQLPAAEPLKPAPRSAESQARYKDAFGNGLTNLENTHVAKGCPRRFIIEVDGKPVVVEQMTSLRYGERLSLQEIYGKFGIRKTFGINLGDSKMVQQFKLRLNSPSIQIGDRVYMPEYEASSEQYGKVTALLPDGHVRVDVEKGAQRYVTPHPSILVKVDGNGNILSD